MRTIAFTIYNDLTEVADLFICDFEQFDSYQDKDGKLWIQTEHGELQVEAICQEEHGSDGHMFDWDTARNRMLKAI